MKTLIVLGALITSAAIASIAAFAQQSSTPSIGELDRKASSMMTKFINDIAPGGFATPDVRIQTAVLISTRQTREELDRIRRDPVTADAKDWPKSHLIAQKAITCSESLLTKIEALLVLQMKASGALDLLDSSSAAAHKPAIDSVLSEMGPERELLQKQIRNEAEIVVALFELANRTR